MSIAHKSLRSAYIGAVFASFACLAMAGVLDSRARCALAGRAPPAAGGDGTMWAIARDGYAAIVADDEVLVAPRGAGRPGRALRLRTLSARRGAGVGDTSGVGTPSASGVTIHHGTTDEHVEAQEKGIEQTWSFGVRPAGAGDLVVRVGVEGNRYAGRGAHGLAFVDDETRVRMIYGDGTWVDAHGVRTEVPARFVDGAIELRVASAIVEASAFPAILDPSVGPELAMDAPVFTPVTSPDRYEDVEVGYGAGTYLVTWFDGSLAQPRQAVRVRATDGVVLDASPIGLVTSEPLAIASDGTNFLLAWSGGAARLAIRDGTLLEGPGGFVTPTLAPGVAYVASTGDYVEAWSASANVSRVAIKASTAVVGATSPVAVSGAGQVPTVAGAASGALVAWSDQRSGTSAWDIFGSLPSTSNFPIAHSLTAKSSPTAASNGTDFFVAWNALQLSGTRVRASDGMPLDGPMGIPLSGGLASTARASFDGSSYVVAYAGSSAIHVVRVAPIDGSLLDGAPSSGGITVTTASSGTSLSDPSIASSSTESLVAWVATDSSGASVVMASRVRSTDGAVVDGPTGLALAPSRQHTSPGTANAETLPVVAADGTNFLVSWLDDRVSPAAVPSYGTLVRSSDGALLAPSAFPLPIAPVALAFDGTSFFASGKSSSTRVRRTDGVELDLPNGIGAAGQSVACVAGTCLVVESRWVQRPSASYPTVFFQRIRSSDGALLDPPGGIQISQGTLVNSDNAFVAAGSGSFLVAWREQQHSAVFLKYAIVDLLGHVTGPFQVAGSQVALAYDNVAADGTNFLATYSCNFACYPSGLMATRIRESDGTLLDGVPGLGALGLAPVGLATTSTATFDGKNFLILYEGSAGVLGTRVRPSDGALLDGDAGTGFPVTSGDGGPFVLASAGQGRSMVAYSTAGRILARLIDEADGILDAGGSQAEGAVAPLLDGGTDGQPTEGGAEAAAAGSGSDAAPGDARVADADADGSTTGSLDATTGDAPTGLDSGGMSASDEAGASLDAGSLVPLVDGRVESGADAADAATSTGSGAPGGGGGSGGCSIAPGPSSDGRSGGTLFLMVAGAWVFVRARRRAVAAVSARP